MVFPADQVAAAFPNTGFTSAAANTVNFNLLQPTVDLKQINTTTTLPNLASQHISAAVAGRFTEPSMDQMAYAAYGNGGLTVHLFSGSYPANSPATSPVEITSAAQNMGNCDEGQAYGDAIAMAAGDLDNAVDINGNHHDELVVSCREPVQEPSGAYPLGTAPYYIRLQVFDFSAWVAGKNGAAYNDTYDPSDPVQNASVPISTELSPQDLLSEVAVPYTKWPAQGGFPELDVAASNNMAVRVAIGDFDGDGQNEIALVYVSGNSTDANSYVVSIYRYTTTGGGSGSPVAGYLTKLSTTSLGEITGGGGQTNMYYQMPHIAVAAGDFLGTGAKDLLAVARVIGDDRCGESNGCHPEMNERLDVLTFDTSLNPSISSSEQWSGTDFTGGPPTNTTKLAKVELASGLFLFNPTDTISDPPDAVHYNYTRRELALVFNRDAGITLYPLSFNQVPNPTDPNAPPAYSLTNILGDKNPYVIISNQNVNNFSVVASQFKDVTSASGTPSTPEWSVAVSYWEDGNNKSTTYGLSLNNFGTCPNAPTTFCVIDNLTWGTDVNTGSSSAVPATLPLVAYDYAGNSTFLGAPVHISADNIFHYDSIIQEPPKHMYWNAAATPEGNVKNISNYDTFITSLVQGTSIAAQAEKTQAFSWGVGTSLGISASATISGNAALAGASETTSVNTKIAYDHNATDTTVKSQLQSYSLTFGQTTPYDDALNLTVQSVDIWRYRVFGPTGNSSNAFVDFVIPAGHTTTLEGGLNDDDYQPTYENNNILTYPQYDVSNPSHNDEIASFSVTDTSGTYIPIDPESLINSEDIVIGDGNVSQAISFSNTITNSTSVNTTDSLKDSVELKQSVKASAKLPAVGGASASLTIDLAASSNASWANATVSGKTLSSTTTINFNTGTLFTPLPYGIWPALYVTPNGTMKYAFGVDLVGPDNSYVTKWGHLYGSLPDAALNLPHRFTVTYPNGSNGPEVWKAAKGIGRKQMRDVWLIDQCTGDPVGGGIPVDTQQVNVQARVYNLSTGVPIGETISKTTIAPLDVQLQFIAADAITGKEHPYTKCPGNYVLARDQYNNLNGRCVINSLQNLQTLITGLEPLQATMATIPWDTTGFGPPAGNDASDYHLYVVLDPNNKIKEVYEAEPYCKPTSSSTCPTDGGQNNEGYVEVSVGPPPSTKLTCAADPSQKIGLGAVPPKTKRDLAMGPDSLEAMDHQRGLLSGSVEAYAGEPLRIRVGAHTDHGLNQYDHIWVWEEHNKGLLLASKKVHVDSKKGGFAWFDWTPRAPGQYTLHAKVFEDRDDTNQNNNTSKLVVNVVPVPPAPRR